MSKYNNITHLVHYNRNCSCKDSDPPCLNNMIPNHPYFLMSAAIHHDGYRVSDRVFYGFDHYMSYDGSISTYNCFYYKTGKIAMHVNAVSDAEIEEFLANILWNRKYKIIKCCGMYNRLTDVPYMDKADILTSEEGLRNFIRNESAKIIQNYWRDARLNPYCRLGNRTINKFYDEYMNDLESKK